MTSQTLEDDANANGDFDTKEGIDIKDQNVQRRQNVRQPQLIGDYYQRKRD